MKPSLFTVLTLLVGGLGIASAIIAIPALEERVRSAEIIVVGTIKKLKADDKGERGEVIVERVLKGNAKAGAKIPVRWKTPPPKNKNPNLPQLPDYTFRPTLDTRLVILLQPRKGEKQPYALDWGSTERIEDEKKVREALKTN